MKNGASMFKTLRYNSKARWLSYWYQITETVQRNPSAILIIGKGSGIVENAISMLAPGIKIVTFDVNQELLPDTVGDVRYLPFKDSSFDCILCCQVLEHIPFEMIEETLKGFARVAKDFVVISVPHRRKHLKIEIDAPLIGKKIIIMKWPFKKKGIKSKQHYWEINRGVSYGEFRNVLKKYFTLKKTFLNEINCVHRFFILENK